MGILKKERRLKLEEEIKQHYGAIAAILKCCVTEEYAKIYLAACHCDKQKVGIYFLSRGGQYVEPLKLPLDRHIAYILNSNADQLKLECQKVFDCFKRLLRSRLYLFMFSLDANDEFKADFRYKNDFPKGTDHELIFNFAKYFFGMPIGSGIHWAHLSDYLKSKKYLKTQNKVREIKK